VKHFSVSIAFTLKFLLTGLVAVGAGAIMPGIATSISTIFSTVTSAMSAAADTS